MPLNMAFGIALIHVVVVILLLLLLLLFMLADLLIDALLAPSTGMTGGKTA